MFFVIEVDLIVIFSYIFRFILVVVGVEKGCSWYLNLGIEMFLYVV